MGWIREHIGWRLDGFLLTVVLVSAFFWILPNKYDVEVDRWILVMLTVGFFFAAAVIVYATDVWTPRGLGVLGGVLGDAFLYLSFCIDAFSNHEWLREHTRDLARGFFIVGVPLLIAGLLRYVNEDGEIFDNLKKPLRFRRQHRAMNERHEALDERDRQQNEREAAQDARDRS